MEIEYKDGKVRQKLDHVDLYLLEGSPKEAVKSLKQFLDDEIRYYGSGDNMVAGRYADGASSKKVKFTRLYLKVGIEYDEGEERTELQVWGERPILPEEQAALDATDAKAKAENSVRERAEFERLKKQYGGQ
jgi:hypothetical protein